MPSGVSRLNPGNSDNCKGHLAEAQTHPPLKDVQVEVVPLVVLSGLRVVVLPLAIVDRNTHLGRISIIEAVCTAVVFTAPEILWVVNIRVVVEPLPILGFVGVSPSSPVSSLCPNILGPDKESEKTDEKRSKT